MKAAENISCITACYLKQCVHTGHVLGKGDKFQIQKVLSM